jgi:hypothetical protein
VTRKRENAKADSKRARALIASVRLLRNRTSAQLADDLLEGVGRGPVALRQRTEAA